MKKIKLGFIGAGGAAHELSAAFLENKFCDVKAVCSRTIKHAEEFARILKINSIYTNYEEMLKKEELDAVCITTPNYLHSKMSIDSANEGLHILVEKPLCNTLQEAEEMIKAAHDNDIILMPAFCERFNSIFNLIQRAISSEIFGKITFVRGRKSHLGPYTSWSPKSDEKWFFNASKAGGGSFSDLGSHVIDYLQYMLIDSIEKVLHANLETLFHPIEYDDNAQVLVKFKSGIIGMIETSWCSQYSDLFEIHGTKGKLIVSRSENQIIKEPNVFSNEDIIKSMTIEMFKENSKKKEVDHFIDCIINSNIPIVVGEDGKKALEVVLQAQSKGLNAPA
ncbi:MAG: Gfo/Idh/MocA family protein [Candidatus Helarchaeota archaeon]